jgi:coproporphyrinogen III oxidase
MAAIMNTNTVAKMYQELQQEVIKVLEKADGKGKFEIDHWEKSIGSGISAVMQNGSVIEKAGVNFSHVEGSFSPNMEKLLGEKANRYSATGISSILHSGNPFVPTIHMNVRYFSLDNGAEWFGGGIDLTPAYIDFGQAKGFHRELKAICDRYDLTFYPKWKAWADDYFYIPHREETRGVGGIFFDRVKPIETIGFGKLLQLTADLTLAYPHIYARLMDQNGKTTYTGAQKEWQKIRRGRYVEFNLVYDRGTKFGLESGGNTESILVSLPHEVAFHYKHSPVAGSPEAQTLKMLKKGIDWLNIDTNTDY